MSPFSNKFSNFCDKSIVGLVGVKAVPNTAQVATAFELSLSLCELLKITTVKAAKKKKSEEKRAPKKERREKRRKRRERKVENFLSISIVVIK